MDAVLEQEFSGCTSSSVLGSSGSAVVLGEQRRSGAGFGAAALEGQLLESEDCKSGAGFGMTEMEVLLLEDEDHRSGAGFGTADMESPLLEAGSDQSCAEGASSSDNSEFSLHLCHSKL